MSEQKRITKKVLETALKKSLTDARLQDKTKGLVRIEQHNANLISIDPMGNRTIVGSVPENKKTPIRKFMLERK